MQIHMYTTLSLSLSLYLCVCVCVCVFVCVWEREREIQIGVILNFFKRWRFILRPFLNGVNLNFKSSPFLSVHLS